jgi:hypothetical protein
MSGPRWIPAAHKDPRNKGNCKDTEGYQDRILVRRDGLHQDGTSRTEAGADNELNLLRGSKEQDDDLARNLDMRAGVRDWVRD